VCEIERDRRNEESRRSVTYVAHRNICQCELPQLELARRAWLFLERAAQQEEPLQLAKLAATRPCCHPPRCRQGSTGLLRPPVQQRLRAHAVCSARVVVLLGWRKRRRLVVHCGGERGAARRVESVSDA